MNKILIGIDLDGVVADFVGHLNQQLIMLGHTPPPATTYYYIEDAGDSAMYGAYQALMHSEYFFYDLPMIEGAYLGVNALERMGYDVCFVTTPVHTNPHCYSEKVDWVVEHFTSSKYAERVILCQDKTLFYGDLLIDDKPSITGLRTPCWKQIIFDQPWNQGVSGPRMMSWDDLDVIVEAVS